ncbi:MAG: YidC/Oxa1 family membrane protein insertase [Oscillospiraceae bacterium]|nr:YidC/Oxa1 family membrane protein insertase [Oscillospiraceae bacterium]
MSRLVDPFAWLLRSLYSMTGSYGVAIILFGIVVKMVLFFFAFKAKKGMLKQQRLMPKVTELQKKYKNDRVKLGQEQQKLYEQEGVSPTGGCLWNFIPMPIIIALFGIIRQPLRYLLGMESTLVLMLIAAGAPGAAVVPDMPDAAGSAGYQELEASQTWVSNQQEVQDWLYDADAVQSWVDEDARLWESEDKEEKKKSHLKANSVILRGAIKNPEDVQKMAREIDTRYEPINFTFLGIFQLGRVPRKPWDGLDLLAILPVLSALVSFASAIIIQKFAVVQSAQPRNTRLMMLLLGPGFSLWFGFMLPAALSLYWMTQNLIGIPQEYFLTRHFNGVLDREDAEKLALEERKREAELRQREEDRKRRAERIAEKSKKKKPKRYKMQNSLDTTGGDESKFEGDD